MFIADLKRKYFLNPFKELEEQKDKCVGIIGGGGGI
jgi:hypothetical protein